MLQTISMTAAGSVEFNEPGRFFRLLSATDAVDVFFYRQGQEIARAEGITGGYAESFDQVFDRFKITSSAAQSVQFVSRLGSSVSFDTPPNGNVTVTNVNGAFSNAQKTVTNASGQVLAANASRRYLLIQNNDTAGNVFVRLDGVAATVSTGIKLVPGASLEVQGFTPTGAIYAIGDIASNANVVAVEG